MTGAPVDYLVLRRVLPSGGFIVPDRYLIAEPSATVADLLRVWPAAVRSEVPIELRICPAWVQFEEAFRVQAVHLDVECRVALGDDAGTSPGSGVPVLAAAVTDLRQAMPLGRVAQVAFVGGAEITVVESTGLTGADQARVDRFLAAQQGRDTSGRVWESSGLVPEDQ